MLVTKSDLAEIHVDDTCCYALVCTDALFSNDDIARILPALVPTWYRKPPGEAAESPRTSWARGKRWSGLTGGEIMSTHDYPNEGVC
jgi:hypothetical protein